MKQKKKNEKSNRDIYSKSVILLFAVLTITAMFIFIYALTDTFISTKNTLTSELVPEEVKPNERVVDGIITSINEEDRIIEVYSPSTGLFDKVKVISSTEIIDEYEMDEVFYELEVGDCIVTTFDRDTRRATKIEPSPNMFMVNSVTNVRVVPESQKIILDDNVYYYNEYTSSKFGEKDYNISNISPKDVISFSGMNDEVYKINVESSHTKISFKNYGAIENPTVEIDRDEYYELADNNNVFDITTGVHKIVVKGDNISHYVKELNIMDNSPVVIDLTDATVKSQNLMFTSNVDDYALFIDDVEYDEEEVATLKYGNHTIRAQKEGYTDIENSFIVDDTVSSLYIKFDEEVIKSVFEINTSPAGADVYIDNELVGITPLTTDVDLGKHNVIIRSDGYLQLSFDFIAEDELHQFSLELTPDGEKTEEDETE